MLAAWLNSFRRLLAPLAGRISWRVWLGALCLGLAWLWLYEHDARLRQQALVDRARRDAAAELAALKKQAAAAAKAANGENAQAVQELQARRQLLARRDQALASQLSALRREEQARAAQVAALPTSEVVTRTAAQLGLESSDLAVVGEGSSPSGVGAIHASPARTKAAPRESPDAGAGRPPAPSEASGGEDTAPTKTAPGVAVLPLTASGARKLALALSALDACRAQRAVDEQRISNGRDLAAADAGTIARQADSLGKLNQALAAKDQILARQEALYRQELRAARGSFWGRLGRTARHVAVGVAVGVVIGVAVR